MAIVSITIVQGRVSFMKLAIGRRLTNNTMDYKIMPINQNVIANIEELGVDKSEGLEYENNESD